MTDITDFFGRREPAPAPRASGGLSGLLNVIAGEPAAPARPLIVKDTKTRPMVVTSVEDLVACGMITPGLATQVVK